jgi:hypothetical protein
VFRNSTETFCYATGGFVMAHDKDGNLLPMMLSDLIKDAQATLDEYGDMPVGLETCVSGYEFNEEHSLPASGPTTVISPRWLRSHWIGKFQCAFVLDGA